MDEAGTATGVVPGYLLDVPGFARWMASFAELVARDRELLTELDAAVGDGDYGLNLDRGMTAVVARMDEFASEDATVGSLCKGVAMTLMSTMGGTGGPLFGTFFLRLGTSMGDVPAVTPQQLAAGLRAGLDGLAARGGAKVGDKTMIDAIEPAVVAIEAEIAAGRAAGALVEGARAAAAGCDRVTPLAARKGRASYLGERAMGHADPGATSAVLLFEALRDAAGWENGGL